MLDSTGLTYFGILGLSLLVILRKPAVAVGLFMCTYGLEQWAQSRNGWFFANGSLTNLATALTLVFAVGVRQVKGIGTWGHGMPISFWLVVLLLAWSALSTTWSPAGGLAWDTWVAAMPYVASWLLLMPLVLRDASDGRASLLMALALGSGVLVLLLTTTNWTGRQITLQTGAAIGEGSQGNPLAIASLGGWIALIALLTNFRGFGRAFVWARYGLVLLGTIVVLRAESRGQLIALLLGILIFLPASRGVRDVRRLLLLLVGGTLAIAVVVGTFVFMGFGESDRWQTDAMVDTYSNTRFGTAMVLLNAWIDAGPIAWLLGLGSSASFSEDLVGTYPHLVALEVLGELGLFGFLLFVSAIAFAFVNVARLLRLGDDPELRGIAACLGALLFYELVLSFKQGSLLGSPALLGFAVLPGRLWLDARHRRHEFAAQPSFTPLPGVATDEVQALPPRQPRPQRRPRPPRELPRPRIAPTPRL